MIKKKLVVLNTLLVILLLGMVGVASAGVNYVSLTPDPTAAPPTPNILGPYTMTPFPADPSSDGSVLSSISSPLGGSLGFTGDVQHLIAGSSWSTWSHGYTGDVYWTQAGTSLTLTMPPETGAFYFYAEPDQFSTFQITATTDDGTTSGPVDVAGFEGAKYFGFYGTDKSHISTIEISCPDDFAVGEFGIASPPVGVPEFPSVALPVAAILGLVVIFGRRKNVV